MTTATSEPASEWASKRKLICAGIGLVSFFLILFLLPAEPPEEFSETQVRTGLAILAFAAILWLTEAIPLAATALLVPILGMLTGVFSNEGSPAISKAFAGFAHYFIFLFLGGFAIAAALNRQGLSTWLANGILRVTQGRFHWSAIGLFLVAASISMWISNTATTALLYPVALGLLTDVAAKDGEERSAALAPFLLLGIAYSATMGGIATIIGTGPNAFAADKLDISFIDWIKFGLPCAAILLVSLIALLFIVLRPGKVSRLERDTSAPFQFTPARITTLVIFLLTVAAWLSSKQLSQWFGITKGMDSVIAILAMVLLCALGLVRWKDVDRMTEWSVLILFGGGITLSKILELTGASTFLAHGLVWLSGGWPFFLIVGAVVLFVIFLTEVSSNTATVFVFFPIFYEVGKEMGVPPEQLVIPLTLAASCAFMLPIATPPNAIVFGSGKIPQKTMMRVGIVLNLIFALILTGLSSVFF